MNAEHLPAAERLRALARNAHLSPDPAAGEAYAALYVGAMPEVLDALDEAERRLAELRPSVPDRLYDPEADVQRGDVVRSLVAPGLWTYLPEDPLDPANWRGPCAIKGCGCDVVSWHHSWDLPEHLVLVARSVPVAQPPTVPPATDSAEVTE
jgi:hypothetical protein